MIALENSSSVARDSRAVGAMRRRHRRSMARRGAILIAAAGLASTATPLPAAEPVDWPCEQVLVSNISAAVVWDGPSVEGLAPDAWRNDRAVADLVRMVSPSGALIETSEARIARFARTQPRARRNALLTLVFAGVLETLNDRRRVYIRGIRRFTRQQMGRAGMIEQGLSSLEGLKESKAPRETIKSAEDKLFWQQRMFDEKEQAIRFLCEQPLDVERALGELARALSAKLD